MSIEQGPNHNKQPRRELTRRDMIKAMVSLSSLAALGGITYKECSEEPYKIPNVEPSYIKPEPPRLNIRERFKLAASDVYNALPSDKLNPMSEHLGPYIYSLANHTAIEYPKDHPEAIHPNNTRLTSSYQVEAYELSNFETSTEFDISTRTLTPKRSLDHYQIEPVSEAIDVLWRQDLISNNPFDIPHDQFAAYQLAVIFDFINFISRGNCADYYINKPETKYENNVVKGYGGWTHRTRIAIHPTYQRNYRSFHSFTERYRAIITKYFATDHIGYKEFDPSYLQIVENSLRSRRLEHTETPPSKIRPFLRLI